MSCCDKGKKKNLWSVVIWTAVVVGILVLILVLDAKGQAFVDATPIDQVRQTEPTPAQFAVAAGEHGTDDSTHSHANSHEEDGSSGPASTHADHDHSSHEQQKPTGFLGRLTSWLGKFHPAATDLPIAMLMGAAAAELLLMFTGRAFFDNSARFMVWLAALSAVPAVALGWFYAGFRWADSSWVMTAHRWLGTGIGLWALVLLLLCHMAHRQGADGKRFQPWYRIVLFIGAAGVAVNGFLGGSLVYGLDHYAW